MVKKLNLTGLKVCNSAEEAAHESDALIVLTEWEEFSNLEPGALLSKMKNSIIVDTRNILNKATWQAAGASFPKLKE